jgi:hypothetical protein
VINASEIELIEEEVKEKEEEEEEEENEEEDKFIMTTKEIEKQNYCFSHHYCSPFFFAKMPTYYWLRLRSQLYTADQRKQKKSLPALMSSRPRSLYKTTKITLNCCSF